MSYIYSKSVCYFHLVYIMYYVLCIMYCVIYGMF